ncbi:MAG: hypothetical protein GXX96_37065 [Planctomycetaceae bacterium]|nr:hypothetical protein [Planctomycetaceae bacterium]
MYHVLLRDARFWDFLFTVDKDRDGCRKRTTPLSVRFLGRKVYLGAVVVLVAAMRQGPSPSCPAHCSRRSVFPHLIAWHLSALAAAFVLLAAAFVPAGHYPIHLPEDVLIAVLVGSGMGWTVFFVVDGTCRFVNWADNFMGKKTTKRE